MATMTHRFRSADRARQEEFERLLSQQGTILRSRKQVLRDGLPTATSGVLDFEEHALDAEEQDHRLLGRWRSPPGQCRGSRRRLQRLEAGEFGTCSDCRCRISDARLRAVPFAGRCLACQAKHDIAVVSSNRIGSPGTDRRSSPVRREALAGPLRGRQDTHARSDSAHHRPRRRRDRDDGSGGRPRQRAPGRAAPRGALWRGRARAARPAPAPRAARPRDRQRRRLDGRRRRAHSPRGRRHREHARSAPRDRSARGHDAREAAAPARRGPRSVEGSEGRRRRLPPAPSGRGPGGRRRARDRRSPAEGGEPDCREASGHEGHGGLERIRRVDRGLGSLRHGLTRAGSVRSAPVWKRKSSRSATRAFLEAARSGGRLGRGRGRLRRR